MVDRSSYNLNILKSLEELLLSYPDLRFIQALWVLGIVDREDRFFEEPNITLERVKEKISELRKG